MVTLLKLLFQKMKKYWYLILLTMALLFGQAMAELTLPDYMGRIVNTGITQGGVEDSLPRILTEDSMEKMGILMPADEYETFKKLYTLESKSQVRSSGDRLLKNIAGEGNIYYLTGSIPHENTVRKTDAALLMKSVMDGKTMLPQGAGSGGQTFKTGPEGYNTLKALPSAMREGILEKAYSSMDAMEGSILKQGAARAIGDEYEDAGLAKLKVQNGYILRVAAGMIGIAFMALIASLTVGVIASRVAADFGKNLRDEIFTKVMSFSEREFSKFSTASLITRSNNDIQQVQNMLVMLIRIIFYAPILGVGGIIKALSTNVSMGWIIALAVIVIILVVAAIFSLAMPLFKRVQNLVDRLQLVTREILSGLMVIKAFVTGKHEKDRFTAANRELTDTNQKIANVMVTLNPVLMLMMNATVLLIVWTGAKEIYNGNIMVGDLMAFMQYAMQIIMSFLMITMVSIMLPRASISLNRISEVLDEEPSVKNPVNPVEAPLKGDITFDHVSFKFDDAPEYALKDINLTIKEGQTTAFIGSTGSGKSTLVSLIPRFHDATEGSIKIGGVDIRDMEIHALRDRIGYIPQKANLFSGTILSNMRIGKNRNISEERIKSSLETAQAEEMMEKFPDGINHMVSQGGTNFSGGQKQRLAVARAVAGNPPVYIFDDSFSALDFKTDLNLRKALKKDSANSTVIIVAQRIGTIINADRIVVLDEGKVVGQGKHSALLGECEIYRQIASSQLKEEELANGR